MLSAIYSLFTIRQNFRLIQTENICRRQNNVAENLGRIENIAAKGENACYQHFLHLPQCFQNASFSGSFNVGIVWKRTNFLLREHLSYSRVVKCKALMKTCASRIMYQCPNVHSSLDCQYYELTLNSIDTHFNASTTDSFLKTLCEKEKLLITSNFSFSHNVFQSIR